MFHRTSRFLSSPKEIGLVAACFQGGQRKDGVQAGPREFYLAGLINQLSTDLGYTTYGDIREEDYRELRPAIAKDEPHRGMRNPRSVSFVTREIARKVYEHARLGRQVITLGGDHSIGIGSIAGMAQAVSERLDRQKGLAVIWIDAHADLNTPESSTSGNIHGMPLAFLTGLATSEREEIFGWLSESHRISFDSLVYIGLRDLDACEEETIKDKGIMTFTSHDVKRDGAAQILRRILAHIGPDKPIHLVFDIDGLDPSFAPSTGMPVEGGLSLDEIRVIARGLFETGQIVGIDLVEVNPKISPEGLSTTIQSGIDLIRSTVGDHVEPGIQAVNETQS